MSSPPSPAIAGVHPYADKFPMLPEDELAELAESIRANGLRQPIVVTPDGLILDGRNRNAACELAAVAPDTVVYEGADLAEYVIDANITRRNMSTGARAMATALVLAADGRRSDGRWKRGSVIQDLELGRAWQVALVRAGVVLDFAPDLASQVASGDLALDAAFRQAEDRRDAERRKLEEQERLAAEEADARVFVEEMAPDLAAQVGDDGPFESFVEARDVWNRRNREEAARLRREEEEAKRRTAEEKKARSELYTGMAKALSTIGGYGGYSDITELMARYDPAELYPPQMERYFSPSNLADALNFVTGLIQWSKETQE